MTIRVCAGCGAPLKLFNSQAVTCSTRCRVRVHREVKRAQRSRDEMFVSRRWVRALGKVPMQRTGRFASSTDPSTWARFADVQQGPGDGYGFMLGAGWGCYDLDHVTDAEAEAFIASIPERVIYCERSMSGAGVHVFVSAPEDQGWRRNVGGIRVERYTQGRFIRMTGVAFPAE